jgi:hypothetical protein
MLQVTECHRTALPPSMFPVPRTAASLPASADAELIALGKRLKPLFERWQRQTASAGPNMSVGARERLYQRNDQLHREAAELIDEILSRKANSVHGIGVQLQAVMLDTDIDALVLDPDTRRRGFLASLCAFTGVAFPIAD